LAYGVVPIVLCALWDKLKSDTKNDCQNPELMTYGRRPIEFAGTPIENFELKKPK